MTIFATINPIDPGTGTRVTVRVCGRQNADDTGAAGQVWWPAMINLPTIQMRFFDGDFTSGVDNGSSSIEIRLDVLRTSGAFPRVERYDWAGADVTFQRLSGGALVDVDVMKVDSFASDALSLGLRLSSSGELSDADVLRSTYAGTGGAEGGADLKGQLKPWAFGRCVNVEPVFIDQIDNVFQVSGYGPVQAISAAYERGASFGASIGNFATYALLLAANIPEGRWGTCLAQGMIRLGAPPAGVITCDVDGDNTAGFLRRTGAILIEIANRIGVSAKIDATSLTALDTAVPRNVNIVLRDQTSYIDLVQRMVAPCNAVPGINASGKLIASRVTFGAEQFVLDAQARQMPAVLGMARQNTQPPYKRIQMGAARSWRVHNFDEIAFYGDLIDRGLYDNAQVYREGDIVSLINKSRWVYIGATAAAGNTPPIWPTTINAFWDNLEPPASEDPAISNGNITIDGTGNIQGIGMGAGTPVNNGRVVLEGVESARPGGGNFVGQLYSAIDTGTLTRWNGTTWERSSDITTAAVRTIVPQFPIVEIKQGEAGHTGNRVITHIAKRGGVTIGGGTWSLVSQSLGSGSATIASGTGAVTLSGIVQSGSYTIRYTHTDTISTDMAVNVTFIASTATNPAFASRAISTFSTSAFAAVTTPLTVVLPGGVTSVALTAASVDLELFSEAPSGTTTVEMKWQRETSPGTWSDVGAVASSSPNPAVFDFQGFFGAEPGSITCNRTATGLSAGSTQTFRLVARISAGNVRLVIASGTASASA